MSMVVSFSYYVAGLPHVVITDLDMLKEITVKHFDKFRNKYVSPCLLWGKNDCHLTMQPPLI